MVSKPVTIALPRSEDGMTGRQCPRCEGKFRVHLPTVEDQCYLNLRCPYCRFIDRLDRFLTGEQRAYWTAIGRDETLQLASEVTEEVFSEAFDDLDGGGLLDFEVETGSVNFGGAHIPSWQLDVVTEEVICGECSFRYAVQDDRDGVCPLCR
jgi:DNA-directed RNA polymerase subunit RPC12/RpoP